MQVDEEYNILRELTEKSVVPVPQALYRSTAQDKWVAGVDFIIMSYVEVWTDIEGDIVCMLYTILHMYSDSNTVVTCTYYNSSVC